jgi:CheY-like chemotaxis protein
MATRLACQLSFLPEQAPIPSAGRELTVGDDREHWLDLTGLRVLVVEDEALVLLTLEDMLTDLGCHVVVSAQHVEEALRLALDAAVDVALLDVNVGGTRIDPVAHILATRGIPIVFVTGYEAASLPPSPPGAPDAAVRVAKPFQSAELARGILQALGRAGPPP